MSQNWTISDIIKELGEEFNQSALLYKIKRSGIDKNKIRSEIQNAIEKGYLKRFIEVRCCECGADLGKFESVEEIPDKLMCDLCDSITYKNDPYFIEKNVDVIYILTPEGKQFFRGYFRKIISALFGA